MDPDTTAGKLADLEQRLAETVQSPARARILALLDEGSFDELDALARHRATGFGIESRRPAGDGVVVGSGTIDGHTVCVYSQDITVFGGSLGEVHGSKIVKLLDRALTIGCPVIGIIEGGGARIQEGVVALGMYGEIFRRNTQASGVIPQISVVVGPAAGGHVYSPALTDFVVMVEQSAKMFITGPEVIATVTGEQVSAEDLGGARAQLLAGTAHLLAHDEGEAFAAVRDLLSYLPANNLDSHPGPVEIDEQLTAVDRALDQLIPDASNQPYDITVVARAILDDGELFEIQPGYAPNIVCGFGRVGSVPVGVVANQPLSHAGALDIAAAEKAARFIRTCDSFNVAVITLVDVPGFLPGVDQEHQGIIRRGAKLIYAYAEATVPLITVITRKAFGGAYDVMGSKHLGADINLAWPTAQIAVMGAEGAVNLLYRRELAADPDPVAARQRLVADYNTQFANPYLAADRGYLDQVIAPRQTRVHVARALNLLSSKRMSGPPRKHGNIPL